MVGAAPRPGNSASMQKAMELYERAASTAVEDVDRPWCDSILPHPEAAYRLALWHDGFLDDRTHSGKLPEMNQAKALEYYKIAASSLQGRQSLTSYRFVILCHVEAERRINDNTKYENKKHLH